MKTDFTKQFDKDVNKINDATITDKIKQAIVNVEEACTLHEIPELKNCELTEFFTVSK